MQPISLKYAGVTCCMLLLLCLSVANLYAQRKEITYKDNKLVLFVHTKDTTEVVNPLTGEEKFVVTSKSDDVLSLNREKVHKTDDEQAIETLKHAIEQKIKATVGKLGKATYNYYTETVVINKQGKVVYVQPGSIYPISVVDIDGKEKQPKIPDDVRTQLNEEIVQIIESTKVPPIEVDGEPVNVVVHINGNFVVE
jgi:hypothetical protein